MPYHHDEGALQRLHMSHPTPPCPALGQGMVNLPPQMPINTGGETKNRGEGG